MRNNSSAIIFFSFAALYILFGYGVTVSNDSVTNIEQITALDLWSRSSHFSFHLFGIIFYLLFSKVIGLSAVASIEIMLAITGAAGALSLYQITIRKFNNFHLALIAVIIYALSSGIFRFSAQVEYLILVPSLGLISLYFYSSGKFLIAGIIFGLALLASPFAILIILIFFFFTSFKEILRKNNLVFGLSLTAVYLSVIILTYQETVSGHWSYGSQVDLYKEIFGEINFLRPLSIYVYGYLRSFNVIVLILPFILYGTFKLNRELFYILIITLIIHLPAAIPEARYGGYQITAYPVLAIATAYYFNTLLKTRKNIVYLILTIFMITNFYIVYSERSFFRDLKETYVSLNQNLEPNSVLIIYQAIKPVREVYAPDLRVYDVLSDYQNKLAENYPGFVRTDLPSLLEDNETVYLLESGVSMPDDNLKLLVSGFTKKQGAKVKGFALDKLYEINSSITAEKLDGYPLDVFKITSRNNQTGIE